jgi:hypothetical protein
VNGVGSTIRQIFRGGLRVKGGASFDSSVISILEVLRLCALKVLADVRRLVDIIGRKAKQAVAVNITTAKTKNNLVITIVKRPKFD